MNPNAASESLRDDEIGQGRAPAPPWPRLSRAQVVCLVAVLVAFGWAFEPTLVWLYKIWIREPDYTHGFLVVPIVLVILWHRWPRPEAGAEAEFEAVPIVPWWPGWLLVVAALAGRAFFNERGMNW